MSCKKFHFTLLISILDKCLLEYYGGCDDEEVCATSRNSQNCAGCVDGFVPVITNGFEVCESKFLV